MFTWRKNVSERACRQVLPGGVTRVIVYPSEAAMLLGWLAWLQKSDPDVLNVFQASLLKSLVHIIGKWRSCPLWGCDAQSLSRGCV